MALIEHPHDFQRYDDLSDVYRLRNFPAPFKKVIHVGKIVGYCRLRGCDATAVNDFSERVIVDFTMLKKQEDGSYILVGSPQTPMLT